MKPNIPAAVRTGRGISATFSSSLFLQLFSGLLVALPSSLALFSAACEKGIAWRDACIIAGFYGYFAAQRTWQRAHEQAANQGKCSGQTA